MPQPTPRVLLQSMKSEVLAKASFSMAREGLYKGVLKASFAKCFEFAEFVHGTEKEKGDEGAMFVSGALRGLAEDFIALKFLRKLSRKERDSVIRIEMMLTTAQLIEKQSHFFRKYRPSQPVLRGSWGTAEIEKAKNDLTTIGQTSKLWNTAKKLPSIEQMAKAVKLKYFYEFIYRMTSRIVHFNVGVSLRSGWGNSPSAVTFSSRNFSRYYLELSRFYSLYILASFCKTFRKDLRLSPEFMKKMTSVRSQIEDALRWPEAITFEEMNIKGPNELIRALLLVAHSERRKKRKRSLKSVAVVGGLSRRTPSVQAP